MFVSPAFAQSAGSPGMGDFMGMILPLVMIMAVFWFLLIRPQQRKLK
jgi:preprotein translocase subunit YajC